MIYLFLAAIVFFIPSIITVTLKYFGVTLGGIPTFILYSLFIWGAKKLFDIFRQKRYNKEENNDPKQPLIPKKKILPKNFKPSIPPIKYTVEKNIEQGLYTIVPKPSLDGLIRLYQDGDYLKSICITKPRQIKLKKNMEIHLYDCDIQR